MEILEIISHTSLKALRFEFFLNKLVLFVRNNTCRHVLTAEIVWINAVWVALYLNPSKATGWLNIFTHRSSLWALQVSKSQRSEEVCCSSLQLCIDLSETSLAQLITLFLQRGRNNKPGKRNRPAVVWVIHFNCRVTALGEKLQADICRNWVCYFCFAFVIDVAMCKIDWEVTVGGK